jgi:hypothetical protein
MKKVNKILTINIAKYPDIENSHSGFYRIEEHREKTLKYFDQTLNRIKAIMKFLFLFSPESDLIYKTAYLRAALAEFVSIEEVLANDLKINNIKTKAIKIKDTQNPLFHILKQLRNFNIHIGSSRIGYSDPTMVTYGKGEKSFDAEIEFPIIDNFNIIEFNKLQDAKCFDEIDKEIMVEWFNQYQRVWGVAHLVYVATLMYCDEIIMEYKLNEEK